MSCSIALRRSPKPGAFTATLASTPRSPLTACVFIANPTHGTVTRVKKSLEGGAAGAEGGWEWPSGNAAGHPRIVAGWSLGAAVAAQVAARHGNDVAGVMLLSPWDRLAELARLHYPAWLVDRFLPERYDSVEAAARIAAPALVVHGDHDTIIPIALARRLHDALPEPKRWVEVPGAGHNDLLARRETWEAMRAFLAERGR